MVYTPPQAEVTFFFLFDRVLEYFESLCACMCFAFTRWFKCRLNKSWTQNYRTIYSTRSLSSFLFRFISLIYVFFFSNFSLNWFKEKNMNIFKEIDLKLDSITLNFRKKMKIYYCIWCFASNFIDFQFLLVRPWTLSVLQMAYRACRHASTFFPIGRHVVYSGRTIHACESDILCDISSSSYSIFYFYIQQSCDANIYTDFYCILWIND